jgi:hypothetical protein
LCKTGGLLVVIGPYPTITSFSGAEELYLEKEDDEEEEEEEEEVDEDGGGSGQRQGGDKREG